MTRIIEDIKLDFADVLIRPKRSSIDSRANVDLGKQYYFCNSGQAYLGIPLIAANMDTVGCFDIADQLAENNMMTAIHKYYSQKQYVDFYHSIVTPFYKKTWYTVGISDGDREKLIDILNTINIDYPPYLLIDVANGHNSQFVKTVKEYRKLFSHAVIAAGNVAVPEMVQELILDGGADIVKVGIGCGSHCSTRNVTGVGYPQLSAIMECADAAHGLGGHIIADGGCKEPGDIVKAFGAGADFVMLGTMLAGTDECEGEWKYEYETPELNHITNGNETGNPVSTNERLNKQSTGKKTSLKVYGMASQEALNKYNNDQDYRPAEGLCSEIPYKGPVKNVIKQILGGLRSACTYVGSSSLKDLPKCITFVKVNRTK